MKSCMETKGKKKKKSLKLIWSMEITPYALQIFLETEVQQR